MTTQKTPSYNVIDHNSNHWNLGKVVGMMVIVVVALIISLNFTRIWLFGSLFNGIQSFFREDLGLPFAIANALSFGSTFTIVAVIMTSLWGLLVGYISKKVWILVFGGIVIYCGGMMLFSAAFEPESGKAQRKYAIIDGQCKLFDIQSEFDPDSGKSLLPITPYMMDVCKRLNNGKKPSLIIESDPSNIVFFSPVSGEPLVWYSQHANGEFVLFDAPGNDPQTGRTLSAITESVVLSLHSVFAARNSELSILEPNTETSIDAPSSPLTNSEVSMDSETLTDSVTSSEESSEGSEGQTDVDSSSNFTNIVAEDELDYSCRLRSSRTGQVHYKPNSWTGNCESFVKAKARELGIPSIIHNATGAVIVTDGNSEQSSEN